MPVHPGRDANGMYYQWGSTGSKFYYGYNDGAQNTAMENAAKEGMTLANEARYRPPLNLHTARKLWNTPSPARSSG